MSLQGQRKLTDAIGVAPGVDGNEVISHAHQPENTTALSWQWYRFRPSLELADEIREVAIGDSTPAAGHHCRCGRCDGRMMAQVFTTREPPADHRTIRGTCASRRLDPRTSNGLVRDGGRPHAGLGPGIGDPPHTRIASFYSGHQIRDGHRVVAAPVLGGLHYEYRLESIAA